MTISTPQRGTTAGQLAAGSGGAHAKAILLGEHAVLHGSPALAIPVPRLTVTARATQFAEPGVTSFLMDGQTGMAPCFSVGLQRISAALNDGDRRVEVVLRSEIPAGRGLGSSAACARAAVLALADLHGRELDQREVYELVQLAESVNHGRASGVDAATTGSDYPLLFRDGTWESLRVGFDGMFVIADSGVAGQTKDAVRLVHNAFERQESARGRFVDRVSALVRAAVQAFTEGDAAGLGRSMTDCHTALRDLGVSTSLIDLMADAAVSAGALGAKISGGGLGGCVVAVVDRSEAAWDVSRALCTAGAVRTWTVPVGRFVRDYR